MSLRGKPYFKALLPVKLREVGKEAIDKLKAFQTDPERNLVMNTTNTQSAPQGSDKLLTVPVQTARPGDNSPSHCMYIAITCVALLIATGGVACATFYLDNGQSDLMAYIALGG